VPEASTFFKDREGNEWDLELNVGIVEDIHKVTGVQLDDILQKPEELAEFFQKSPGKLVGMLWVICEPQAVKRGIDASTFGRLFYRDVTDAAVNALLASIVTFYPRTSAGNVLRKKLPQILAKMDQKMEQEATIAADKVLSDTLTN
jgi:hypothetical protein